LRLYRASLPPPHLTVENPALWHHKAMKGKKALPINPQAWVTLREMPGTRVAFWVVESCPYCTKQHFHLAGARDDDPEERLGEAKAPCRPEHTYILALPPRAQTKGGKRAQQRRERRENRRLTRGGALEDE